MKMVDTNFNGVKYFVEDGSQSYLVFNQLWSVFKRLLVPVKFVAWKSKGFSEESVKMQLH